MINQAMIFAAGLGKRMLPLTHSIPKPLVKVNDYSLLENSIEKLLKLNFNKIVVNSFHLSDQIIDTTARFGSKVEVVVEETRLETGGGLLNCLIKGKLNKEFPVILINGDIYWQDIKYSSISKLLEKWDNEKMDIIMCMKEKKSFFGYDGNGDYDLLDNGEYSQLIYSKNPDFVFTGLQIIDPKIISDEKKIFSLKEVIDKSIKKKKVYGINDNNPWFHIGTIESLEKTRRILKDG